MARDRLADRDKGLINQFEVVYTYHKKKDSKGKIKHRIVTNNQVIIDNIGLDRFQSRIRAEVAGPVAAHQ